MGPVDVEPRLPVPDLFLHASGLTPRVELIGVHNLFDFCHSISCLCVARVIPRVQADQGRVVCHTEPQELKVLGSKIISTDVKLS